MATAGLPESVRGDIAKYQDTAEKLRIVLMNKQQLQLQLAEINSALEELNKTPEDAAVYKVVGGLIMVARSKKDLVEELSSRKETIEVRLSSLKKQEELLRKQLKELEKRVTARLGYGKGGAGSAG